VKYKLKGFCETCSQNTWVRSDSMQGVVCKNCEEPVLKFKNQKTEYQVETYSQELYPKRRKAV
jgi:hypothetical protein